MKEKMTAEQAKQFDGFSAVNYMIVKAHFAECNCEPYETILTYNRWRALGYQVQKGEHGAKITTFAQYEKENENGDVEVKKRPWTSTVFCRHQVTEK